jgi:RNA polymerase sigma factor (sigma-70 family)
MALLPMSDSSPDSRVPNSDKPLAGQPSGANTEFLLKRVASGEETNAWGVLSGKCVQYLSTRFGRSAFPQGIEFADFVSEVMLRIITSIDSFEYRGKDSFWKWVQTLAGNLWRDMWRKNSRDKRLGLLGRGNASSADSDSKIMSTLDAHPDDGETPTQMVRFIELSEAEANCVKQLPEKLREVYLMRRQSELSFAEIAAKTGIENEATLRSNYMRARDKVRLCLGAKIDALGVKIDGWQ